MSCVAFKLAAQNSNSPDSSSRVFQKDSVALIESLISNGKKISETDTLQGLQLLRIAASTANRQEILYLEAKAYFTIGEVYYVNSNYDRSINNYTKARNIYAKTGAAEDEALSQVYMARAQYYRGNYTLAALNLNTAIEKARKANSKTVEAEANEYLGLLYNFFQNFNAGADFSKKSFEAKKNIGDTTGYVRVANKLSDIYYEARKFDSALYYAGVALQGAEKKNMNTDIYLARFSIVASLIRLKKLNEAQKYFRLLQEKIIPSTDLNFSIRYYVLLANYQLARGNKTAGNAYYDTALNIAGSTLYPETRLFVYKNIAESYYELNDLKTAYEFLKKYNQQLTNIYTGENAIRLGKMEGIVNMQASENEIKYLSNQNEIKKLELLRESELRRNLERENRLKDSILQKEKLLREALTKTNALHTVQLENEKKLHSALKRENDLQQGQLNSAKKLRLSLLIGLSVTFCMAAIIFYQYHRQKHKNSIIKKQADELQTLIKEIHHRVKNNMQIVSSLLDLQSLNIKDGHASEAVKESKNRVLSMALIHQNLYHEGNIKGIQMKNYIQNLALNLFDSYNMQKDKVKLKTDIDNLNLDVDTVIPIGLIVNELISNSLKYAFKGKESGELAVALKQKNSELVLEVQDNGNGFPEDWDTKANHSFGYKLIKAFAKKLKAKLDVYNDNGACFVMHIAKYKMA
jgi:two-component sensor histidine kinase